VHYLITSEIYLQKEATPKSELKAKRKAALQCTNRDRQLANSVVTCPAAAKIGCPENNLCRPITVCVCALLYSLSCINALGLGPKPALPYALSPLCSRLSLRPTSGLATK